MQHRIVKAALIAAAAIFLATPCVAAESKSNASAATVDKSGATGKSTKAKAKAPAPTKLVDINRAGKSELKRLPGIGDAEADKIVAGRPYHSKADLVTRNILPAGIYEGIKKRVMAKP